MYAFQQETMAKRQYAYCFEHVSDKQDTPVLFHRLYGKKPRKRRKNHSCIRNREQAYNLRAPSQS
jgi:hypothetical protein